MKKKNYMEIMKLNKKFIVNSDYVIDRLRKALKFPKKFLPLHEPTFSKYEVILNQSKGRISRQV